MASISAATALLPAQAQTAPVTWPQYLHDNGHSSYAPTETALTPATAPRLGLKWHFDGIRPTVRGEPGNTYYASPVEADGAVFIGSDTGWFYKLNAVTGEIMDKTYLGFQPAKTCRAYGIIDTATVATDPDTGDLMVYVGGPAGYLYAFYAANLRLKWKSVIAIPSSSKNNYFEWSSPTVANGRIYVGVASLCDRPLIRGGVNEYNQVSGNRLGVFHSVPKGQVGGAVWSTVAVSGNYLYATTGNGPNTNPQLSYAEAIVKINATTMQAVGSFHIPRSQMVNDSDFGASPTLFGRYVGACNKNGYFYAVRQSNMSMAWEARIGTKASSKRLSECLAAAAYDGKNIFLAANGVTIHGVSYRGSIQKRHTDGSAIWETGLSEGVSGAASLDGGGLVVVGTFDNGTAPNRVYLVNEATGQIVASVNKGWESFAQSSFAGGWLFTANNGGVYAYGLPGSTAPAT